MNKNEPNFNALMGEEAEADMTAVHGSINLITHLAVGNGKHE